MLVWLSLWNFALVDEIEQLSAICLVARQKIRRTVARCVEEKIGESPEKNTSHESQVAKYPEAGQGLSNIESSSEAFGFIVAGSYTTSGTLTLLFYHHFDNTNVQRWLEDEFVNSYRSISAAPTRYQGGRTCCHF
ncbi:hypothetical protein N7448_011014 [Penicillium atrosanguineum]|nr:hypothetical protein N7448_011014 [Penicillium atrosanguineum]